MPIDEPSWWYGAEADARQRLLQPLARAYGWAAARRLAATPRHVSALPVVCIGNFTAGGTGKTPLTLACLDLLAGQGRRAVVLSRGYGGRARGPRFVDAAADQASTVGDEPMLIARTAAVVVARDRIAGARLIEATEPAFDVIILDDGLQNPALARDVAIAVVDARRGLGNGAVIPAGPLRAPLSVQLPRVDMIVVNQPPGMAEDDLGAAAWLKHDFEGPVLTARPVPVGDVAHLRAQPVVAFSGIANPGRFFDLLETLGIEIAERVVFKDHHAFTEADARRLLDLAEGDARRLVTTEKDWVRLPVHGGARAALRAAASPLPIRLVLPDRDRERLAGVLAGLFVKEQRPVR